MNTNMNGFFHVEDAVLRASSPESYVIYNYTYKVTGFIYGILATVGLVLIGIGIIESDVQLLIVGAGVLILLFFLSLISNSKPIDFILKFISRIIYGKKIKNDAREVKSQAISSLYELRDAIKKMGDAEDQWRLIGKRAETLIQHNLYSI